MCDEINYPTLNLFQQGSRKERIWNGEHFSSRNVLDRKQILQDTGSVMRSTGHPQIATARTWAL